MSVENEARVIVDATTVAESDAARNVSRRRSSLVTRHSSLVILVVVAALLLFPLVAPTVYVQNVLTEILIWGILAMSLDLLIGYTGLVSFGHAAFFGVAAYAAGIV